MSNTLTAVTPKLLAQGLLALREQSIMARLVNRSYDTLAAEKGATVDVPIPSAIAVQNVSPAATPPATADVAPTSVPITLSSWKEAPFYLTDKDVMEAMNGTIPMQASEAIKALANQVDSDVLATYVGVYGYAGVAGTTPFGTDLSEYIAGRVVMANQVAPMDDRRVVLDPTAEGNALLLRAFQDASFGGGDGVIIRGQIGTKVGADWFMDQNVPTHTAGTGTGILVNNVAGYPVGTTSIAIDTGTGTLVVGDIVSFAGHSQTYTVTAAVPDVSSGTMVISPGLQAAVANNEAVTKRATHVVNLLFHRDAIALATRPLMDVGGGLGNLIQSAVDPVSGLALRLEISREHKRTRFSYDILYGTSLIRPELASRIAG